MHWDDARAVCEADECENEGRIQLLTKTEMCGAD
jgi:hypothetical protein